MPDRTQPYDPARGPRDRSMRAADLDREAVGDILREQHLAGRLDADEFQQRLDHALSARTYADLDCLIDDFPREADEPRSVGARPWPVVPFALAPLVLLAVAFALGAGHVAWLAVPLFFFVVQPLIWHGGRGRSARSGWRACGPRYATRLDG